MATVNICQYGAIGTTEIKTISPTNASLAINDAFTAAGGGLPAVGGRVTIYPCSNAGTSNVYELQAPISFNKRNIHVECLPGVLFRPSATFTGNTLVNFNGWGAVSWRGGRFQFNANGWLDSDGATSAIFFSDATSEGSNNGTRIEGVTFDLSDVTTAASLKGLECVDLRGDDPIGTDPQDSRNVSVRDCRFFFTEDSATISNSLRGIRLLNYQGADVSNNWFGQTVGRLGTGIATTGILLDDCRFWNVHDNHYRGVQGQNFIRLTGDAEGGHGIVRNNTSEFGGLNEVVLVEGNDFTSILGNNFGNHVSLANGHIYAKEKPDQTHDRNKYGRYLLIAGNSFHSATFGADGNPIKLEWRDGVDIQANMYGNIQSEKYYVSVARNCLRVRMNSNTNSVYNQNFTATPAQRRLIDFKGGSANEWVDCAYPGTFTVYT